jgi:hypothetical protein
MLINITVIYKCMICQEYTNIYNYLHVFYEYIEMYYRPDFSSERAPHITKFVTV